MPPIELSVILPAYNEGRVISDNLALVGLYLKKLGIFYEIIVVDDGSLDDTVLKARAHEGVKVLTYTPNRGKGYAIREGIRVALGENILLMDVDLSTALAEVSSFLTLIRQGNVDVFIGNRNGRSVFKQERPLLRALLGKTFAYISSVMLSCWYPDFTCGFKMFKRSAVEIILPYLTINGWAFDSEILLVAKKRKLKVVSKEVFWHHEGNSKVNPLKAMVNSLKEVVKIKLNDMRGLYGR